MIFESPELINAKAKENFNWVLTRFIMFEIEKSQNTIPKSDLEKIDELIIFHEKLENYEICRKLTTYKERIQHV